MEDFAPFRSGLEIHHVRESFALLDRSIGQSEDWICLFYGVNLGKVNCLKGSYNQGRNPHAEVGIF